MRKAVLALAAASLLLAALAPAAAARATRTDFVGFVFPAGYLDAGVSCVGGVYTGGPLPSCVLDQGTTVPLDHGGTLIRDEVVMDWSLGWYSLADLTANPTNPTVAARTGYVVEYFNANLDAAGYGPVWGSWELHDFASQALMFSGHFTGMLGVDGFNVQHNGVGHGAFRNQHMWMNIFPAAPYVPNMAGEILDTHPD